jgi:hypothetical protein
MRHSTMPVQPITTVRGDDAAERACLRCKATFWSEGFGQRICARCKRSFLWRSAVPSRAVQSRRCSSGPKF